MAVVSHVLASSFTPSARVRVSELPSRGLRGFEACRGVGAAKWTDLYSRRHCRGILSSRGGHRLPVGIRQYAGRSANGGGCSDVPLGPVVDVRVPEAEDAPRPPRANR